MRRRDFIISTVAGVGVVSASAYYFLRDVEFDTALAKPQSLSLIWDVPTIKNVGNQYRANTPDEAGARSLVKLLTTTPTEDAIKDDFKNDRIVVVDGWVLSVTEARQCALASTTQSK